MCKRVTLTLGLRYSWFGQPYSGNNQLFMTCRGSKEQHGLTGHVLGGWEVFGLVYYYTGTPLTVTTSNTDPGGVGLLGASASSASGRI
jgi:hypothetical protein